MKCKGRKQRREEREATKKVVLLRGGMALGGESERLGELKVQQLRPKRKRMEGSTDETVEEIFGAEASNSGWKLKYKQQLPDPQSPLRWFILIITMHRHPAGAP